MNIDEILKSAGIEDAETIAKVKAEMPKAYMPLADANKRIAAAKGEGEGARAELEALKAEQAKAQEQAKTGEEKQAAAFAELQEKYAALESRFNDSQNAIKQRDAKSALTEALKAQGAHPAALALLADAGLARIEFDEGGKPANVDEIAAGIKTDNAGLFGEQVDTGKPQSKADAANDILDAFDEGFGDVTPRHKK